MTRQIFDKEKDSIVNRLKGGSKKEMIIAGIFWELHQSVF